jgi:peptide/nickel transport system substrate-binding protein
LRGPRDYAAVRQVLAGAGYHGATIVALAPTDIQPIRSLSLVGTDQLRRAGMNVDLQEMTLGTEISLTSPIRPAVLRFSRGK